MSLRIGWFATARSEGSRRLLARAWEATRSGEVQGEIAVVFCNREPGESPETDLFFAQVRSYRLPLVTYSSDRFTRQWPGPPRRRSAEDPWRLAYDREAEARLQPYPFDVGMLAGYMLFFGREFSERYPLLNLHPALPDGPVGTWQQVIWRLIAQGATESGVMIHRATAEFDRGPVVTYCRYPIRGEPFDRHWAEIAGRRISELRRQEAESLHLHRLIRLHGLTRELPLIIATLRAFADGRLGFQGDRLVDTDGQPVPPTDLTAEIEAAVAGLLPTGRVPRP